MIAPMRPKRPRLKPDEHPRPHVDVPMSVFGDPLFSGRYDLVGWFIHMWCHAVWKKDPKLLGVYDPCTEKDIEIAIRTGYVVVESDGTRMLTGPFRNPRWLRDERKVFCTYAIQNEAGSIKIGKSLDVERRLDELQCASSEALTLLGWIDRDVEEQLHRELATHRVSGEWFAAAAPVLAALRREGIL